MFKILHLTINSQETQDMFNNTKEIQSTNSKWGETPRVTD